MPRYHKKGHVTYLGPDDPTVDRTTIFNLDGTRFVKDVPTLVTDAKLLKEIQDGSERLKRHNFEVGPADADDGDSGTSSGSQ